jgi:hypothetical protein
LRSEMTTRNDITAISGIEAPSAYLLSCGYLTCHFRSMQFPNLRRGLHEVIGLHRASEQIGPKTEESEARRPTRRVGGARVTLVVRERWWW